MPHGLTPGSVLNPNMVCKNNDTRTAPTSINSPDGFHRKLRREVAMERGSGVKGWQTRIRYIFAACEESDSHMVLISNARGLERAATAVNSSPGMSVQPDIPIFVCRVFYLPIGPIFTFSISWYLRRPTSSLILPFPLDPLTRRWVLVSKSALPPYLMLKIIY